MFSGTTSSLVVKRGRAPVVIAYLATHMTRARYHVSHTIYARDISTPPDSTQPMITTMIMIMTMIMTMATTMIGPCHRNSLKRNALTKPSIRCVAYKSVYTAHPKPAAAQHVVGLWGEHSNQPAACWWQTAEFMARQLILKYGGPLGQIPSPAWRQTLSTKQVQKAGIENRCRKEVRQVD